MGFNLVFEILICFLDFKKMRLPPVQIEKKCGHILFQATDNKKTSRFFIDFFCTKKYKNVKKLEQLWFLKKYKSLILLQKHGPNEKNENRKCEIIY